PAGELLPGWLSAEGAGAVRATPSARADGASRKFLREVPPRSFMGSSLLGFSGGSGVIGTGFAGAVRRGSRLADSLRKPLSWSCHKACCRVRHHTHDRGLEMLIKRPAQAVVTLLAMVAGLPAAAQTIYPIDPAGILAGAKFDFKVEFPGSVAAGDLKVTLNGRDAAQAFAKAPSLDGNEEGQSHTAYWIRDASLDAPGTYEVVATTGDKAQTVRWEVFDTPARRVRNVILFIGDGLSMAHRTAARVLATGLVEGRYGGELAIDDMPHMALVSTSGMDSLVTDSANSMSAYATGHKSCVNAMGIYCARNKSGLAHPRVETLAELVKRRYGGTGVGVVTNTEIEDATPAGMIAHIRRRSDYDEIVRMFWEAKPEVMMGGGTAFFLPKAHKDGRRKDEEDYLEKFKAAGYRFAATATDMKAAAADKATTRLLGLFHPSNLDGALDRLVL